MESSCYTKPNPQYIDMPDKKKDKLFIENASRYGFDETVVKLTDEIQKRSWSISFVHDLQQTLKKHDKDVLPVKVFAICHPKHSGRILDRDDERIVSSMMPCRISIYNKSNGITYVSRMNTGSLASSIGGIIEQVMKDSTAEVEGIIEAVVEFPDRTQAK
jgi:uncharacterized protein (DUF302 family)